jgi:type IV secretory pathway TraG/TraD family ATPase VirD4
VKRDSLQFVDIIEFLGYSCTNATRFLDMRLADMEQRNFDDKFFASAWSTLINRLSDLLTDRFLRSLSGADFTALDILQGKVAPAIGRRGPVTVYLRWPERSLEALTPLVRLVWSSLIEEIAHIYDTGPDPAHFFKVLLLVDEAGRAPVPSLAKHITTAAGRGMTVWMALQSLSQLQTEYGPSRAETIKDNCDTQLFYRPANHDGARRLREWLGDESGFAQSRTLRAGGEASDGEHEQAVPLLSEQEITRMPDEETICFHANLPPFMPQRMDFRRFPPPYPADPHSSAGGCPLAAPPATHTPRCAWLHP